MCDWLSRKDNILEYSKQLTLYALCKNFIQQGILLGHVLFEGVQGGERFSTHPRLLPSQVPSRDHRP